MHDSVGVGIVRIDRKSLRQPRAIRRLDRGEAESLLDVAGGDEADPARAEDADAVVEDHVVVGPASGHLLSRVSSATSISTTAGPVFTSAPSGSIQRSGVRIAAPTI